MARVRCPICKNYIQYDEVIFCNRWFRMFHLACDDGTIEKVEVGRYMDILFKYDAFYKLRPFFPIAIDGEPPHQQLFLYYPQRKKKRSMKDVPKEKDHE